MKATPLLCVALFAAGCSPSSAQRPGSDAQTPAQAAQKAGAGQDQHRPQGQPERGGHGGLQVARGEVRRTAQGPRQGFRPAEGQHERRADQRTEDGAVAAKIQAARAGAKQGDIFTAEMRPVFRRLLAPELKGEEGRDAKAIIKDDAPAPGTVPFKVNAKYPERPAEADDAREPAAEPAAAARTAGIPRRRPAPAAARHGRGPDRRLHPERHYKRSGGKTCVAFS